MAGEVKRELDKEEKPYKPLDEQDINILKFYGQNPYHQVIDIDKDVKQLLETITKISGVKESDTGLCHVSQWISCPMNKCEEQLLHF